MIGRMAEGVLGGETGRVTNPIVEEKGLSLEPYKIYYHNEFYF